MGRAFEGEPRRPPPHCPPWRPHPGPGSPSSAHLRACELAPSAHALVRPSHGWREPAAGFGGRGDGQAGPPAAGRSKCAHVAIALTSSREYQGDFQSPPGVTPAPWNPGRAPGASRGPPHPGELALCRWGFRGQAPALGRGLLGACGKALAMCCAERFLEALGSSPILGPSPQDPSLMRGGAGTRN